MYNKVYFGPLQILASPLPPAPPRNPSLGEYKIVEGHIALAKELVPPNSRAEVARMYSTIGIVWLGG
jgi:hypothetical protein